MLYEILFISLAILYFVSASKVDYWTIISLLGFQSETPQLFLTKPLLYTLAISIFFTGALLASIFSSTINWYIGFGLMFILWISSGYIGRYSAFKTYRIILLEMAAYAQDNEKQKYLLESKKSNTELLNQINRFR